MAVPDYLQDTAKDFARQATAAYSAPINTDVFTGRQFVAGMDPAQTAAYGLATAGVGSYAPYLQAAQQAQQQEGQTVAGLGGLTGPMTAAQQTAYMSPYQTQVIDETLRQYDLSRQAGEQSIKDAAVGTGNFGGGREGAMLGQYQSDTLANRAGIRSGLLQQGYMDAQARRGQDFTAQQQIANMQGGLGQAQLGLSDFARKGMGQDIAGLGGIGALQQGYNQALLTADQQRLQTGAYEPYGRLSQYGSAITGLSGGMAGAQYDTPGPSNPWQTALSTALGIGGLYGKIF